VRPCGAPVSPCRSRSKSTSRRAFNSTPGYSRASLHYDCRSVSFQVERGRRLLDSGQAWKRVVPCACRQFGPQAFERLVLHHRAGLEQTKDEVLELNHFAALWRNCTPPEALLRNLEDSAAQRMRTLQARCAVIGGTLYAATVREFSATPKLAQPTSPALQADTVQLAGLQTGICTHSVYLLSA